jgi:hypothetical protein
MNKLICPSWNKKVFRRDVLVGTQRFSNYFFATALFLFGRSFTLVGFLSWRQTNFLPFVDSSLVQFLPQGLAISFYGSLSIVLGLYLFLSTFGTVGSSFTEYDKGTNQIYIFRWGFFGKERCLENFCTISELVSIRLENGSRLAQPDARNLCLILTSRRKIFLLRVGIAEIYSPYERESFATTLAQFLEIPLEGKT